MNFFNGWVIFHGVYVPQLPYPFICWWASRLLPCPGYAKQCCDEHWGARVSFRSGFLGVYAQEWDCWVLSQFITLRGSPVPLKRRLLLLTCGHLLTSPLTSLLLSLCAPPTPNTSNRVGNPLKGRSPTHHVSPTASRSRAAHKKVVAQIRCLKLNSNGTLTFLSSLFPLIGF